MDIYAEKTAMAREEILRRFEMAGITPLAIMNSMDLVHRKSGSDHVASYSIVTLVEEEKFGLSRKDVWKWGEGKGLAEHLGLPHTTKNYSGEGYD